MSKVRPKPAMVEALNMASTKFREWQAEIFNMKVSRDKLATMADEVAQYANMARKAIARHNAEASAYLTALHNGVRMPLDDNLFPEVTPEFFQRFNGHANNMTIMIERMMKLKQAAADVNLSPRQIFNLTHQVTECIEKAQAELHRDYQSEINNLAGPEPAPILPQMSV